ncbi:hypothetical protein [Pseudomonas sp.]|uniref:hypothetical protein n=1 Tax=Pseudomonas sp. TaxID=306 RepID=UPI002733C3B3|nr:hypothetical protein [Pseudomonas sp.]MDP3815785.1 hypothetical protein [Pseudomonas sp.]
MSIESVSEIQPVAVATADTNLDEQFCVLKEGSCASLTGRSTLSYQLATLGESGLHLRLTGNTGTGFFSKDWMPCSMIEQLIIGATELTSTSFKTIFPNKSVNTGGFVVAVLKDLGLLRVNEQNSRWHAHVADMTFERIAIEPMEEEEIQTVTGTKGKRKSKEV